MRAALLALLAAAALAAAGCGLGAGEQATGVTLTVTEDFGRSSLGTRTAGDVGQGDTVMRLLQRSFDVDTRFGGQFVQSIEGITGGRRAGRPVDWFYYVNGIEASVGATGRRLADGDRVWWDFHDWSGAMRVPAVVGSFPAPFNSTVDGRRLPIRLACAPGSERACDEVEKRLQAAGVTRFARAGITPSIDEALLRVVVGPWSRLRGDGTLRALEEGVRASGVYARFEDEGATLDLLDATGETDRRLGGRAGLVAALRFGDQQPTWVVTGTDAAGTAAAAAAIDRESLGNRFAIALEQGRPVSLPVRPAGAP